MKKGTTKSKVALIAILAFGFTLASAGASHAATTCYQPTDNGTLATTVCSGLGGSVRLNVTCNALWPFTGWTDFGAWTPLVGSTIVNNSHAYCAAPLTFSFTFK